MKGRKSGAVSIFIGALLIVVFLIGITVQKNPGALSSPRTYNLALDQFGWLCSQIWLPAGIIGIPLFLVSLVLSLVREKKERDKEHP